MITISIDQQLKRAAPNLTLGVVYAQVDVTKKSLPLWEEINRRIKEIALSIRMESLYDIPQIKALRDVYKSLGKDPARYRGSQEALVRRILQGKGLYQINTIVDINNLVSLETLHSVGAYNMDSLNPPVLFRVGKPGESYKGIGKETINIAELPLFADSIGPFGSPTSDSERAMITEKVRNIMMVVIAFCRDPNLEATLSRAASLLKKYGAAQDVRAEII